MDYLKTTNNLASQTLLIRTIWKQLNLFKMEFIETLHHFYKREQILK